MSEQISLFDVLSKDKKSIEIMTPEVWRCMDTCANMNCVHKDGTIDRFFTGELRCINGDFVSKLLDNRWVIKCKNYKPKER